MLNEVERESVIYVKISCVFAACLQHCDNDNLAVHLFGTSLTSGYLFCFIFVFLFHYCFICFSMETFKIIPHTQVGR